jgi:hypothetical protein
MSADPDQVVEWVLSDPGFQDRWDYLVTEMLSQVWEFGVGTVELSNGDTITLDYRT